MSKEMIKSLELCDKLIFPDSLKEPGPRDGVIQCFIKRDKSNLTFHLFLSLNPALPTDVENGKFLLAAKKNRRVTCTEYVISMDADNISKSSSTYIGKLRSNFLGTKFIIYDTLPPCTSAMVSPPGKASRRFYSKKVTPEIPKGDYNIAQVTYKMNLLGERVPRQFHCTMHSIPASALNAGGTVPHHPKLLPQCHEDSFTNISFSKSIDHSVEFCSSNIVVGSRDDGKDGNGRPLVLRNKTPRWHVPLQCWCLNFRGRVTVASIKNFQLIVPTQPAATGAPTPTPTPSQPAPPEHDKVILQFGRVGKDLFTMDYRYPLSAFQAFAICLSSFDTKLACE